MGSEQTVETRVSKGQDVQLSLCPGTKILPCLVVPLSLEKGRNKNLGTNSSVSGRPGTKSLLQKKQKTGNGHSKKGQDVLKQKKEVRKQEKMFLKQEIIGKNSDCPVPSCTMSRIDTKIGIFPSRVLSQILIHCPVLFCGKILSLFRCPFVLGHYWTSVPLSQKVALFHPAVGNPSKNTINHVFFYQRYVTVTQ